MEGHTHFVKERAVPARPFLDSAGQSEKIPEATLNKWLNQRDVGDLKRSTDQLECLNVNRQLQPAARE
ncbi:hypothetical protein [Paraburkholderia dilworthii]|uniref:hypothetical protein n=1 Tax=Paraburkholderia dilworthii TaxID=948106 RepID=UPI0004283B90|nr:hypothetical protein [Paraburkholderia dilworthii]